MWAHVDSETQAITEYGGLPENWRNISNFFALEGDLEALRLFGWYPLVDESAPIASDLYEYHGPASYEVDEVEGIVVKVCPVFPKDNPPTPEQLHREAREEFMSYLRQQRNERLRESDWTQMLDVQYGKSEEWVKAWRNYRQALRDLPEIYSNPPHDTATDQNQINWPELPVILQ